jgi:hypothetical protein
VKVTDLAETVRNIADPNNRGRQYLPKAIGTLAGTRVSGFVLERLEPTNNREQGAQDRLLVLGNDQNPSASPAASAHPQLGASRDADAADGADAFQAFPEPFCAQCGGGVASNPPTDPPTVQVSESGQTLWLHSECVGFFRRAEP